MRSILGVWVILRPSPHRFDYFIPFFGRILSQTVPRVLVGSNYFRGEQLEYVEYRQNCGSIYCEYSQYIPGFCTADTLYSPSISGFDTAVTPVHAVLLLLILPVLAVFGPSYFRILPYSQYFGVRYCGYSLYLKYLGVRYSWILPVLELFRGLVLLILWVFAVSKFSEYAQYTRSMSYTSIVSVPLRQFHPVFLAENFHRRSHECSLEQITFAGSNWST